MEKVPTAKPNPVRRFLNILGSGLITGASDNDPSGIGTCATARGQLGYTTLWTALFTLPLMESVQFICAKIASVTVQDFAGVLLAMLHASTCNQRLSIQSNDT
jgi:Mn2+/Fe2+ NRAMP family transporter